MLELAETGGRKGAEMMKVQGLIKLEGSLWSRVQNPSEELEVRNCIFDDNSLSLEYDDSGDQYRLEVSSKDGIVFEGKYEGPGEPGKVSLRYYQNKDGTAHLFYGEWSTFAEKGPYLIELFDKDKG
jgi:hypothetical protein